MAKQKNQKFSEPIVEQPTVSAIQTKEKAPFVWQKWFPYIVVFALGFLVYSNTFTLEYAIDDQLAIYENKFTQKGTAGLKEIFTNDAFVGFFGERGSKLITGGRYRPLSFATFALEVEFFGKNHPHISHVINVIWYGLTVCLLLYVLNIIFKVEYDKDWKKNVQNIPFIAALLYTLHPIHTEAVTNIKGRDEIMGLFFGLSAVFFVLKYIEEKKITQLILVAVCYFLGLLSKENIITFLAVVPMLFFVFYTSDKYKKGFIAVLPMLLSAGVFLALRSKFTNAGFSGESPEVLNNPFAKAVGDERMATIIYSFWLYIKILLFPHPLSHDYYFNQIPYKHFSDIGVWFSIFINLAAIGFGIKGLFQKKAYGFAILFYYVTLSVVSNIPFTVGVILNERFVFLSSIGFCLLVAILLYTFLKDKKIILAGIVGVISVGYAVKTYTRNPDWKDNYTLFKADATAAPNSSKIMTSLGGETTEQSKKVKDSTQRKAMLQDAIVYLNKSIKIYPDNSQAWLLLGNAEYELNKDSKRAAEIYHQAAALRSNYYDAAFNLGVIYMNEQQFDSAEVYLSKAVSYNPEYTEPLKLLSDAYYKKGVQLGKEQGRADLAIPYLEKALSLKPESVEIAQDLGVAYGILGQPKKAIEIFEKVIAQKPDYKNAYLNLAISYDQIGDKQKSAYYMQKHNSL